MRVKPSQEPSRLVTIHVIRLYTFTGAAAAKFRMAVPSYCLPACFDLFLHACLP